jgi:hypothetical protein
MPLTIEAQKKLLKALKYSDEDIATLTGDGDNDTDVPAVKVFTDEEYTTLETNIADKGKKTHWKAGGEFLIKELKTELGLEYEGKEPKIFLEKAKEKFLAEAKLPANEAKEQWEKEKKALQAKIAEKEHEATKIASEKSALEIDTMYLKKMPADRNKEMPDEDRLLLLKNKLIRTVDEDGKEYYTYQNKRLQDATANDLSIDDAISHVFKTEKGWLGTGEATPEGTGHGDSKNKPGFFASTKDLNAAITAKGLNPLGREAREMREAAMAANPKMTVGEG